MFGLWKSKEELRKEIEAEIEADRVRKEEETRKVKEEAERVVREQLELERLAREAADKELRESAEPWVEIRAIVVDPKDGARIDLDWNPAFIVYLNNNGITGVDEDSTIQKYITLLLRDILDGMEEEKSNAFE